MFWAAQRETRPALGHLGIGRFGKCSAEHLSVVEAQQRDEAQLRVRGRAVVEPRREQVEAAPAGECD
jgi:hypothetical protein